MSYFFIFNSSVAVMEKEGKKKKESSSTKGSKLMAFLKLTSIPLLCDLRPWSDTKNGRFLGYWTHVAADCWARVPAAPPKIIYIYFLNFGIKYKSSLAACFFFWTRGCGNNVISFFVVTPTHTHKNNNMCWNLKRFMEACAQSMVAIWRENVD